MHTGRMAWSFGTSRRADSARRTRSRVAKKTRSAVHSHATLSSHWVSKGRWSPPSSCSFGRHPAGARQPPPGFSDRDTGLWREYRPKGPSRNPAINTNRAIQGQYSLRFVIVPGSKGGRAGRKPDSVPCSLSRPRRRPSIYACRRRQASAAYPQARTGRPRTPAQELLAEFPLGLAPGGVCRADLVTQAAVVSYTHRFTLTPLVAGRSVLCGTVPRVTSGCC
jgi:hypothetical protein